MTYLNLQGCPSVIIWQLFFVSFRNNNKSGINAEIPSNALDQYVAQIVNMLDPQSHHNPQPKWSSSSSTLNMIPPWNIHTVTVYAKLFQWLFFELVHSLRILSILATFKLAGLTH